MKKGKIITLFFLCLLFGVWITESIFFNGLGLSIPLTVLIFYGILIWVSRFKSLNTQALWLTIPVLTLSLSFFLHYNPISMIFTLPTLLALLLVQTAFIFDKKAKGFFSLKYSKILIKKILIYPFANISHTFNALKENKDYKISNKTNIILGLIISVPFSAIFIVLFASADDRYRIALNSIFNFFETVVDHLPADIFFAFFFGLPLFIFITALYNIKHQPPLPKKRTFYGSTSGLSTFLIPISIVALSFVLFQFEYLFLNKMPYNMLVARYAREGFFQLTFSSGLLLAIVTVVIMLGKRNKNRLVSPLNWLITLLCVLNTFILTSAAKRMFYYIDYHNLLTMKRFLTLWAMFVILAGMVGIVIKCHNVKFKLFRYLVAVWISAVCIMGIINVDKTIARYNVQRYLADEENSRIDVDYFKSLSYTVLPELDHLAKTAKNPKVANKSSKTYYKMFNKHYQEGKKTWMTFRLDKLKLEGF